MLFMIVNAVLTASLLVLVVVPTLYIYEPCKHGEESLSPPKAGEVTASDTISHSVKQKLYLLFVIPACAVVNVLFLYFTYYRPIRWAQYRVEANIMALHRTRIAGYRQLQRVGFFGAPAGLSSMALNTRSASYTHSERLHMMSAVPTTKVERGAMEAPRAEVLRRRARPDNVQKDAYTHTSIFPEVRRLMDAVERQFLTPASVMERNYGKALAQIVGETPPGVASAPSFAGAGVVEASESARFYSSKRTRAGPLQAPPPITRPAPGVRRGRSATGRLGGDEHPGSRPMRNNSVVLVLSDKSGGRRGNSGMRGDAAGMGQSSSGGSPNTRRPPEAVRSPLRGAHEPTEPADERESRGRVEV